jgi:hypothetical protein
MFYLVQDIRDSQGGRYPVSEPWPEHGMSDAVELHPDSNRQLQFILEHISLAISCKTEWMQCGGGAMCK